MKPYYDDDYDYDQPHYGKYRGSYAQDVDRFRFRW